MPLIRLLIPLVMIVALGGMVALMMMGGGGFSPMMLVFPLMMGVSMLAMFMPQTAADQSEVRRVYLRQLHAVTATAVQNADAQREHSFYVHPDPADLWSLVGTPRMWGRLEGDSEALTVRFGRGVTRLCTPITVPTPPAPEDVDPVCAVALRHMVRAAGYVRDVPVDGSLLDFDTLHITGRHARGLARSVIAQLVFHHGPELVGITGPLSSGGADSDGHVADAGVDSSPGGIPYPGAVEELGRAGVSPEGPETGQATVDSVWGWLGWLPHSISPHEARMPVTIIDTAYPGTAPTGTQGACTIIVDVAGTCDLIPGAVLVVADDTLRVQAFDAAETIGVPDSLSIDEATVLARRLSGYRRAATAAEHGTGSFHELLGLPELHQLRPEDLWGPRTPQSHLALPIGYRADGAPMLLDVKESAKGGVGPHGLCIGATGSGKSELLRTLVTALAVTHSPEDVNMVLVDFKGGATFLGLEKLPHTSAVITNLAAEQTLVDRMHDAISGEMNRRQQLLRDAGNFANIGEYNSHAAAQQHPGLPALLIIVDEFSELLGQHAEFAELFAAVGRLGRSLGIHLLLASQRLDEGRLRGLDSHLSYRIGLKTFSASESRQVLGITDAYHLPATPGAGFMKTDADHVHRFQAAYVSGPLMLPPATP